METTMIKDDNGKDNRRKREVYYYIFVFSLLTIASMAAMYYDIKIFGTDITNPYSSWFPLNMFALALGIPFLGASIIICILMLHTTIINILRGAGGGGGK
jgi:hypothetical protein